MGSQPNSRSSQQMILRSLQETKVPMVSKSIKPLDLSDSKHDFKPTITLATTLPEGAHVRIHCKGAKFQSETIQLETSRVTTIGDKLTVHRQIFSPNGRINLFHDSAYQRDCRRITHMIIKAGTQHARIGQGRVGGQDMSSMIERQLNVQRINTLAALPIASQRSLMWQGASGNLSFMQYTESKPKDLMFKSNPNDEVGPIALKLNSI